jgi:hypothetical protein
LVISRSSYIYYTIKYGNMFENYELWEMWVKLVPVNFQVFSPSLKSHDNSVGIALGYGLDDLGSRVRFLAGAENFSLYHRVQNGSGAHPASYPMGTRGSFPGVKWARCKADHSFPSSAEVKNAWSYTSTPSIYLHGVVLS